MDIIKPTQKQLDFQDWELGIFIHFGIRTFYEGHRDWDDKKMDASSFNPSELDCEQWARNAKDAGFNYMVLVAKHHDGFANWPSEYTNFSVASSPWKDGRGDVVREFTDACHKHDLKVGLYYSPADRSCPVYDDPKAYDDYFINQISELLDGRYGDVNMLWFDGCGSENHKYDWPRIIGKVRDMQPNLLIFNMGDPDYRWCGNESGLSSIPNWNVVDSVDFSIQTDEKEALKVKKWLPSECDFMIRDVNWFYSDLDEHTVKSPDELVGNYFYSVGRGCNMLLNIGPDRRGLLPEKDVESLLGFGRKIKDMFSEPVVALNGFKQEQNTWSWDSPEWGRADIEMTGTAFIDHAILQEDLTNGEHVNRFRISILPYLYGKEITVYEGYNIGHKAICKFPLVRCRGIKVEILEADGDVTMKNIEFFRCG